METKVAFAIIPQKGHPVYFSVGICVGILSQLAGEDKTRGRFTVKS